MSSAIVLIAALVILLIAVALFLKKPTVPEGASAEELQKLKSENERLKVEAGALNGKINGLVSEMDSVVALLKDEKERISAELMQEREKLAQANQSLESARSYYKAQQEKIQEQKAEVEQIRVNFQREFENIASKLLDDKSQKFVETNKLNLDQLLNPLKENIKLFEEKVEKVYKAESDERNVLKGEITKLMELNKQISEEANNLTKALKSDSKKQGNWGEIVLDRILEALVQMR